jgi:hypothetical protein
LVRYEKEMLMRKKRKHHPPQLNLFQAPITTPHWEMLPHEVRKRVRHLLVQLLREARENRRAAQAKEVGNE